MALVVKKDTSYLVFVDVGLKSDPKRLAFNKPSHGNFATTPMFFCKSRVITAEFDPAQDLRVVRESFEQGGNVLPQMRHH
jgi:hypothetical protein